MRHRQHEGNPSGETDFFIATMTGLIIHKAITEPQNLTAHDIQEFGLKTDMRADLLERLVEANEYASSDIRQGLEALNKAAKKYKSSPIAPYILDQFSVAPGTRVEGAEALGKTAISDTKKTR